MATADDQPRVQAGSRRAAFMALKREVLALGGSVREFFVSLTPSLTVIADAVIDLDRSAAARQGDPAPTGACETVEG